MEGGCGEKRRGSNGRRIGEVGSGKVARDGDGMKIRKDVGIMMEGGGERGQWIGKKEGGRDKDEEGLGREERVGMEARLGKVTGKDCRGSEE